MEEVRTVCGVRMPISCTEKSLRLSMSFDSYGGLDLTKKHVNNQHNRNTQFVSSHLDGGEGGDALPLRETAPDRLDEADHSSVLVEPRVNDAACKDTESTTHCNHRLSTLQSIDSNVPQCQN